MKRRSGEAVAAQHRKSGGPMKHRLEPKGGAMNDQPGLLDDGHRCGCEGDYCTDPSCDWTDEERVNRPSGIQR